MTTMAKQLVFKEAYIAKLLKDLVEDGGTDRYFADSFTIEETLNGEPTTLETSLDKPEGLLEEMMAGSLCDAAISLYKAYETLTPLEASRKYLWVYLEHTDLFPYMKKITKTATKVSSIKDNWFGSSIRGALSSLWWMVYLTAQRDKTKEEERFKYTRFFMEDGRSDLRLVLSQSTLFRCPIFVFAVLDFFMSHTFSNMEAAWRYIMKYFNRKGGMTQIASLNKIDITSELDSLKPMLEAL